MSLKICAPQGTEDVKAETKEAGMVERVAKAISGAPFPSPASYRKARAAIAAMCEPTDSMVWAGATASDHPSVYMDGPSELGKRRTRQIYRAAIQEALSQDTPHAEG